MHTHAGNGRG